MRPAVIKRVARKIANHAKLLRSDPELFARNVSQFTNPALFEQRLIDVRNAVPMNVAFDPAIAGPPTLNVLDASWSASGMTGGPNTVINLALRIAGHGVSVRLVSTVSASTVDPGWLRGHAKNLLGSGEIPEVAIVAATNGGQPLRIGPHDVFLATHWTTAQQLKAVLPRLRVKQFLYMLQEFEPGFYAWSSNFALALETLGLDYWPIVNERLLADFLFAQPWGRLSDPIMRKRAVIFEPAVDRKLFHPAPENAPPRPRRLLFYARPTNSRNLFGLGLMALRIATADPAFANWEFLSIGSRDGLPELSLANGHILRRAPWKDYVGYGELLRDADIILCPMLSPHTSYPVLEMVASGGLSVTNAFATKTKAALSEISRNIVAVEPTIDGFADGLREAARRIEDGRHREPGLNVPGDWNTALGPAAQSIAATIKMLCREA